MGKAFSIVGLVFGSIGIATTFLLGLWVARLTGLLLIPMIVIPVIAIVFGALGIAKDDSRGMGIAGVVLGAVSLGIILAVYLFALYLNYIWPVPVY